MKVELDEGAYMPEKAHEADKEEHERYVDTKKTRP